MRVISIILVIALAGLAHAQGAPRDPTRPPTQAEIDAWFGDASGQRERARFSLQSILLAPDRRIAIIDGQRLRVGERIDGAQVRVIEAGRVVLERDGETIELDIDTHLTNNNDGSRD